MGGAVPALVQRRAGGVQEEVGLIFPDGKADFVFRAGFRELLQLPAGLHALNHCLFDDALAVGDGEQGGIEAVAGHGEGGVFREQAAPGERPYALKERVKSRRRKAPELQQHALAAAQGDVRPDTVGQGAGEEHAPVLRPDFGEVHAAQFVGDQTFQPEQAGNAVSEKT